MSRDILPSMSVIIFIAHCYICASCFGDPKFKSGKHAFSINVFMCVVCLLDSCIIVGSCYCDESKHECKKLSKRIGNYQKLIQSNPTSHPPNEKKYTNNR